MVLTLDEFRATKAPCDDVTWNFMQQDGGFTMARDVCSVYATDAEGGGYLIHEDGGKFYVHAWWYKPIGYDDLATAEARLYDWYLEWAK